jgi:hypothetical protein
MDKALIERLGREAGREVAPFEEAWEAGRGFFFTEDELMAFAALIADECAKVAESFVPQDIDTTTWEQLAEGQRSHVRGAGIQGAEFIASAIRSKFSKGL